MNDDGPGIGLDFSINTEGAFSELLRFAQFYDDATRDFVRQAAQMEAAGARAVSFTGASAKTKAFATSTQADMQMAAAAVDDVARATDHLAQIATRTAGISIVGPAESREADNTTRAINATASAIEKRIFAINKEAAALGLSRAEQRAKADADLAALATTQLNTEGAERLDAALRNLSNRRRALAEDQFEADMRAEAAAATAQAAALARVNGELMERSRLQSALDRTNGSDRPRATDAGATFSALAAKAAEDEARAIAAAGAAAAQAAREHEALATAVRASHAAQLADAEAAERLRMATDPLYAATSRLNAEIAESTRLYRAGATAPAEYARQQDVLAGRLRDAEQAHHAMAGAMGKTGKAAKLSQGDMLNLGYQINDIVVSLVSGQKPFMVFAQQGAQIGQIAASSGVGMGGMLRAIGGLAAGFAPLIGIAAVAVGGLALFNRAVSDGIDTQKMVDGLGLTRAEIKRLENTSVSTGDVMKATFQVLAQRVGLDLSAMKGFFGDAMDWLTVVGRRTLSALYTTFVGTFSAIAKVVQGVWAGKGVAEILSDAEKAYDTTFKSIDGKLKRFGADVNKRIASNKLTDLQKQASEIMKDRTPDKAKIDKHAESLARDAAAAEAQIRNLYALAKAYETSGAAALIAEARAKAESEAIKKRGNIEEMVDRQVRLVIAQRVADAAKSTATMNDQARAQAEVNGMVAAGLVPAERANELVQERMQDLPLLYALEAAQQRGLAAEIQKVTDAQKAQKDARENAKAAEIGAFYTGATQQAERQLALQREELKLVGATDRERARAMATIQATQVIQAKSWNVNAQNAREYIAQQLAIADAAVDIREEQNAYNRSLTATGDLFNAIHQSAQLAASGIADAFGRVGSAVGEALTIVTGFYADQARLQEQHIAALKEAGTDEASIARENRLYAIRTSSAQINAYGDMAAAAKGFFKTGSAGYKALGIAEKAYRAIQFALSAQAMIQDAAETVRSVFNSGARAAGKGAEGIAEQSKLVYPYNIIAMAATGAALVAAGIAVMGGGGGGGPAAPTAKDYQERQGTGSVLGDTSAKSESISRSLELMLKNTSRDLEYSSEAVKSLRAIESGIGNLAAAVARETSVGGGLDASALGLGTNTSGGLLGVGGLFSKKITRELNDAGLQFDGASVASVIAGGITANLYQEVLKTTKKSGLFGIGGSTKTTTSTVTSAADAGLTTEVSLLVANMRNAIVDAAGTIGIDGAAAMLDAFQINIGRISFKDLTSEEIESELAAVFSRVGDDMAGAVGGAVAEYQRAGEGMLETLVRLAKEYQTVDVTLRSIGMTFGFVGLASVGARTALVELFGGLDEFTEATSFFRENFLSEAEQMAPVIAAVRAEMDRLGLASVTSKDAFKSVVLGLDLSSASGQEMYAALMAVAPAFAKSTDYLASLNGELKETAKTAEQLAAIEKQRRSLEIQLMEATGDTAGALAAKRADELAGMDESLRALQQQVWSTQEAAQAQRDLAAATEEAARASTAAAEEAARAAAALVEQRRGLEIDLMEATGNAVGALAARRADEIAALDASLRPIKEAIFAAQDAAAAQEALAAAQTAARQAAEEQAAAALALAQTRRGMEIELMEALGDASGALAARRADELAGTDASLRALREQIFAAQDAAAANAALAQAQQDAASAAASAAAEMAAAAAQVASQRSSLEIQLMRAQGNEAGAVSAERAAQLAATDESLRALQEQVWAAEDARKAAEAAAQAQAAYAQQMQEAAQAAQQAAQDAEQLRRQRAGMDAQLLDLLGDAAGALALRRQEELGALDASLRPLQQSIWAQEDLAAAATAAADRVNDARSVLTDAYKRESDALQQTIDTMGGLGESLRKYRAELAGGDAAAGNAYLAALGQLNVTDAKAARGDAGALAALEAAGKDFLTVSRDQAGSLLDYQRDVARVAAAVDRGIGATDEAVDYAQAQLDALKNSVAGLIDVNESVISVRDAITALQVAIAGNPVPTVPAAPVTATSGGAQPVQVNTAELERRIDSLSARLEVQNTAVAENTGKMSRLMERWEGAGLLIRTDDDTPLLVTSDPA